MITTLTFRHRLVAAEPEHRMPLAVDMPVLLTPWKGDMEWKHDNTRNYLLVVRVFDYFLVRAHFAPPHDTRTGGTGEKMP